MFDKFIYVFSEADKNALLSHGYVLLQEPKATKATVKKKAKAKDGDEVDDIEEVKEVKNEVKYWVFMNKSSRDMIFNKLEKYVFSNTLTL